MSGLSERQLFAGYGVPYDEESAPEPARPPRPMHVLTPLEIRQRIAAHQEREAEQRAIHEVRVRRMVGG